MHPAAPPPRRAVVWFAAVLASAAQLLTARADLFWIWAQKADADRVTLRREFNLAAELREATYLVTCDNGAKVSINGQHALTNDDWGSPTKAEVTKLLRLGRNEILVEARNEGSVAGFVGVLRMRTVSGAEITLETDGAWQARVASEANPAAPFTRAKTVGKYGDDPWGDPLSVSPSKALVVQPADIEILPGFKVELLHVVPKAEQGSWVSLTTDPKGRLLACDQYGSLYRVTPSPVGSDQPAAVEKLKNAIGGAHGLLYAFDSLYVMVNEQGGKQGLWRLRDTDGDDQFDQETLLRRIQGGGEHGPHAIVLSPDKKSIHIACGNHTKLPDNMELSRALRAWDEDHVIPRLWDANGHARGILAPGGYICKTDPDGKTFELVSHGYRNQYDIAFNALGDIFTYDSDMEWDAGTPWYRPTRICLATSGSELGWRSGSGKWPSYYPDSLPALNDVGPGSPTGVESGLGAKFPAKYQHAIFANDWTYGTMYAIHLAPDGAAYQARREEFLSGKPLPLTDLTIHPQDGSLYFAIGGRRTQSALYRVSYVGTESTAPAPAPKPTPEWELRRQLEALHQEGTGPGAVEKAWSHLAHADRWVRFAARTAIERQPTQYWADKVLAETRPLAIVETTIAATHAGLKNLRGGLLDRLNRLDFQAQNEALQLALVRAYQLVLIRLGQPDGTARAATVARLEALFPSRSFDLNRELSQTLIALDSPAAVAKTVQLMSTARDENISYASDALLARNSGYADAFNKASVSRPNQQQIAYAFNLRVAKTGWSPALRKTYFSWFPRTAPWQGGNSFRGFLENFRKDALANVSDAAERAALDELSTRKDNPGAVPDYAPPRGPGRDYSVDDILKLAGNRLQGRDFKDGERLFHAAACFSCHRFNGTGGGVGPDLTGSGSRYTLRDFLENLVDPSKVISDQYGSEQIELTDGSTLIGRAYEENGRIHVVHDPRNPEEKEVADLARVKSRNPYPVSLMPAGLLNAMNAEEVLNLVAYVLSAGDPNHGAFRK